MTLPMNNDYHSTHLLEIVEERQPLDKNIISKSNINVRDKKGRNALYWAIKNHSKRNVGLLLEHNISLTVASKLDAFFHAIASQNLDALMELCSIGLNLDVQNDKGQSLLMKAIEAEDIMMVQSLINQGVDLYLMDDKYDMAIDYAKRCKFKRVFELVHYTVLNDKTSTESTDCTACGTGQQTLCGIK